MTHETGLQHAKRRIREMREEAERQRQTALVQEVNRLALRRMPLAFRLGHLAAQTLRTLRLKK